MKFDPGNVTLLNQKQELLSKSISETEDKLKLMKDAQNDVVKAFDNNHIFGNGTEKAIKELQKVAGIEQDGYAGPITIRACYELMIKKKGAEQLKMQFLLL